MAKGLLHRRRMMQESGDYIQDGLVFQLDGINKGNTANAWTDLIGGNVFLPTGNVVFNTDNIELDGTNYLSCTLSKTNSGTMEACFISNLTPTSFRPYIISFNQGLACKVIFYYDGDLVIAGSATGHRSYRYVYQQNVKTTLSASHSNCIRNGIPCTTTSSSFENRQSGSLTIIGRRTKTDTTSIFAGKLYAIRMYDRELSVDEMLNNQRLDNKRFNLGLTI